jgi:hypothetical protein
MIKHFYFGDLLSITSINPEPKISLKRALVWLPHNPEDRHDIAAGEARSSSAVLNLRLVLFIGARSIFLIAYFLGL